MVKILIRFLGVSAAVVLAVSCGPSRNNQTDRRLDWIESRLNEHPDSALAAVRDLPPAVFRSRAQLARAALLHTIALDKCYIDLQTDSIISPAITYYTSNGTPDEKIKSLYYLGRIQYNAANYRAAIVTYTEALELSNKAKDQTNGEVIHRAPAQIPLTCAFSEENSAITVVYFDDLGSASINIDNNSTGEECQYIVNAVTGVQRYLLR